jgi:hypothetical protein
MNTSLHLCAQRKKGVRGTEGESTRHGWKGTVSYGHTSDRMRIIFVHTEGELKGVVNFWLEIDDEGGNEPSANDLD